MGPEGPGGCQDDAPRANTNYQQQLGLIMTFMTFMPATFVSPFPPDHHLYVYEEKNA